MKDKKIRIGINGYGNIGQACEYIITNFHPDMELKAIFSRRDIKINSSAQVVSINDINDWENKLDVLIICNGSKDDLPIEGPSLIKHFNTVDSYDNHSQMVNYYQNMLNSTQISGKLAIIAAGWDPGKFSKERIEASAYYPDGEVTSFWGIGVSQGHTNAIKEFNKTFNKDWILDAIQYTHPIEDAIMLAKDGKAKDLTAGEKHWRECYIAVNEKADKKEIETWVKEMPGYYKPYNTIINFVTLEEITEKKKQMFHAGKVISHGKTSNNLNQITEYSLDIASNPEHTARILVAHARACYKLAQEGVKGVIPAAFVPLDKLHHESIISIIEKYI